MGISETMKALADPVRREILEILKKGPKSAGEIAQERQKNYIYYHLDATVFEEILVWIAALGGKNNENETEK